MVALVDQFGRPVERTRPKAGRVAAVGMIDRWQNYPSNGLTPQRLAAILRDADEGDVTRQAELFGEMEEKDAHLASVLQTRRMAVAGLPRRVMAYSDDAADKRAAELVEEAFERIDLDEVILDLMDAVGKGVSVCEIEWDLGKRFLPRDLEWVDAKRFRWEGHELRLLTDENPALGQPLPANKFVMLRYKARSGHPARAGMLRPAAWLYLFKNYDVKDWVQYAEVFGMPLRLGKYDPGASKEDRDALLQAVMSIAADAAGVIANTTDIQFVESGKQGGSGADVFERLVAWCERGMSKVVLGQTLTTDTTGGTGTYAAGAVHNQVRHDLLEADAAAVSKAIRRDLIRPIVAFNFGWEAAERLPWLELDTREAEDLESLSKTYRELAQMGLPIGVDHVRERFGIPAPAKDEELLGQVRGGGATPDTQAATTATHRERIPTGALALSSRTGPTVDGDKLDALIAAAAPQGAASVDAWVEDLRGAVDQAASMDELRSTLLERYPRLNLEALRDVFGSAILTSMGLGATPEGEQPKEAWRPLPFAEAERFFAGKTPMSAAAWQRLVVEAREGAFAVAGMTRDDLVRDVYGAVLRAVGRGTTLADFRRELAPVLEAQGWTGAENRWRVQTIFRTNVLTAYSAGHYAGMKASAEALPFWQYDAVGDDATRPSHAAMDGKVFRTDDPIWDTWFPPNGFNCRCTVRALSAAEVQARGLEVDSGRAYETLTPDRGFERNPGLAFAETMRGLAGESHGKLRDLVESSTPPATRLLDGGDA